MLLSLEIHGPSVSLMSLYISYSSPWPCLLRTDLEASCRHRGDLSALFSPLSLYVVLAVPTHYVYQFLWHESHRKCALGKAPVRMGRWIPPYFVALGLC